MSSSFASKMVLCDMVMGLGAMKRVGRLAKCKGSILSLTRAKDADQPLAAGSRQWICRTAMMMDQRLTNAVFWLNINFLSGFCLFGDGAMNCFSLVSHI